MPPEVPVLVKLVVAAVLLPRLMLAGLVYDVAWAVRHRHLYGHAGGEVE